MKVLLVGYFGKANFGDDVLLAVTYALVRQAWPSADIAVQCHGSTHEYVPSLLKDDSVAIVQPGHGQVFDLTVYGGGGVFFDFSRGRLRDALFNVMIRALTGKIYAKLDRALQALWNWDRPKGRLLIGWGIGVGTYTLSSRKMRHHVPVLAEFSGLMVRDSGSLDNLMVMGFDGRAQIGSDIAFMGTHWASGIQSRERPAPREGLPRLGVVLRDWQRDGSSYLARFKRILPELSELYELTFFFLDADSDRQAIRVADGFASHVWRPESMSLVGFAESLASQDALITARAHGAICGAVLGVPSVLIEIEPKLRAVHAMLPNSSIVVSKELDSGEVLRSLRTVISLDTSLVSRDVARNASLARDSVNHLAAKVGATGQ